MNYYRLPMGPVQANCYVLIDEETKEAAVIDPGDFTEDLRFLLKSDEVSKVKYILLTHGHFDHILGVPQVKEHTGAEIAIHENDEKCLHDEHASLADMDCPGAQQMCEADILLHEGDVLKLGSSEIRVLETPGHTKGGVCFMCEDLLFTGDTLFCLTYGRTDFEGGSEEEMKRSLKRLVDLDGDYTVLPGHNRATTLSHERKRNRFIRRNLL